MKPIDIEYSVLARLGEIALKGKNRYRFEDRLMANMRYRLRDLSGVCVWKEESRIFASAKDATPDDVLTRLTDVFGIVSLSPVSRFEGDEKTLCFVAAKEVGDILSDGIERTFKVETRRVDKRFPLNSYEVSSLLGAHLLESYPDLLTVDVHRPDFIVRVEIRDKFYLMHRIVPGRKGLPVGMSGRGLLLLSGGIDSPVAGYRMASRGMQLDAIYFHTYPYTSDEALQKVRDLAKIIARYAGTIRLHVCDFTEISQMLNDVVPLDMLTIVMRRVMMRIAEKLAIREKIKCLITGESLGQVASQTLEALVVTDGIVSMPVFRPLIGFDKDETCALARHIGTFETSILPYEDCCTVFVARHPKTHPSQEDANYAENRLDLDKIITSGLDRLTTEIVRAV